MTSLCSMYSSTGTTPLSWSVMQEGAHESGSTPSATMGFLHSVAKEVHGSVKNCANNPIVHIQNVWYTLHRSDDKDVKRLNRLSRKRQIETDCCGSYTEMDPKRPLGCTSRRPLLPVTHFQVSPLLPTCTFKSRIRSMGSYPRGGNPM